VVEWLLSITFNGEKKKMTDCETLRKAFQKYRGDRKHVHYPKELWDQAVALAEQYPPKILAHNLSVSYSGLLKHINDRQETTTSSETSFIQLGTTSTVRAHFELRSSLISSIDLLGTPEDLASFTSALHRESCQ
jgi:hypothetical protein